MYCSPSNACSHNLDWSPWLLLLKFYACIKLLEAYPTMNVHECYGSIAVSKTKSVLMIWVRYIVYGFIWLLLACPWALWENRRSLGSWFEMRRFLKLSCWIVNEYSATVSAALSLLIVPLFGISIVILHQTKFLQIYCTVIYFSLVL